MVTNVSYNEIIQERLNSYGPTGRQSKATKRGTIAENVAAEILSKHPNVASVEEQVFAKEADEFSKIDVVLTMNNGSKVYVPIARDLWLGTSQQDRLQIQVYKFKSGELDEINYCYLCSDDFRDFLRQPCNSNARRKPTLQHWVNELANKNVLHNIETLWSHLYNL